jgi:hypothetical protein
MVTVGEIAERLRRPEADARAVSEKIRHWIREGLLFPVGDRNPGIGVHRRLEEPAVIDCAVLLQIVNAGIPIVGRGLLYALALAREAYRDWQARGRSGRQEFLELVWERHGGFTAKGAAFRHTGVVKPSAAADVSIIVNLSLAFARIRPAVEPPLRGRRRASTTSEPDTACAKADAVQEAAKARVDAASTRKPREARPRRA